MAATGRQKRTVQPGDPSEDLLPLGFNQLSDTLSGRREAAQEPGGLAGPGRVYMDILEFGFRRDPGRWVRK
jgi:hypothetical protein